MNPRLELESHLNWLLNHSLEAGMLVLLVLVVQWLFRRRLTNRWRFALWWIVLARLLLPISLPSTVSLFNLFQPAVRIIGLRPTTPTAPPRLPYKSYAPGFPQVENALPHDPFPTPAPVTVPAVSPPQPDTTVMANAIQTRARNFNDLLIPCLSGLWLAGVLILGGVVAAQLLRFNRKLARACAPSNPDLQTMLDDCRREFGVSRPIELLETDAVQSPALFGSVRLRLLLPRDLGAQFAGRELRYIFLHELAHVKRGDLWLNWLVTTLQILHWFNPLLWLGFARLRADRELACDELALLRAGDHTGAAYGETVLKLLENLGRPAAIPGLVGILEDKKQMRRRISMIANFRRPGRWSALAVVLILALAAAALTDAESNPSADSPASPARMKSDNGAQNQIPGMTNSPARPDLTGTVSARGGGALPAAANVFIATAAPKTGTSTFCPGCYADCTKQAQTDAQGHFKIESLDPQLTFQILAVAKGCQPKYVGHVDPAKGPVRIELEPVESANAAPDRSLRGRVVNAKGEPVAGAVVEMEFISRNDGTGGGGIVPGVDPLAVTDEKGEFLITAKDPFTTMGLKVSARTYADKMFDEVPNGKASDLVITEGASLTGRVLGGGTPLVGVSVGVSGVDRSFPNYLGHFEVATGARGAFTLVNLPPDADFWLYTLMDSMKGSGAVPLRKIHTGKDGETTELGALVAGPTYRLAGRVVLADGQPVPAPTRLLVGREDAWDSMQIVLGHDGSFDTACPPGEMIGLSVRVKGYHVSSQNGSLDQMNPFRLIGRMDRNITNLVFLLEKGPEVRPDYGHAGPDYMEVRNRPLHGAEVLPDHSREWSVSGHVLDAATQQPVPDFRVTPGLTDNFGRAGWDALHAFTGTNGAYLAYINKRTAEPMLKVEANGYLPQVVSVQAGDATNVNFQLKRGTGPAGTVVQPDGTPAAGASVVLLSDDSNQAGLAGVGELTAYSRPWANCQADAVGDFAFKPEWGITGVAAASSNGFAVLDIESLATNPVIQLEAFGQISGHLKRTSGPGTNEDLDLEFADADRHRSGINLNLQARTDAQGHFEFKGVPPGHFQISYREPMGLNSWQNMGLKEVEVLPGQSLAVNLETTDRPLAQPRNSFRQPPPPKPIPGAQVTGVVLLPNGQPAADADVALQVEGKFLLIGKGRFSGSQRGEGLLVGTGADGSFTLPLYEKAQFVIALNEEGYAQVSLDELKASHEIRLQKWGRIEGTLRVGHHLGTNDLVALSAAPTWSKRTGNISGKTNGPMEMTVTNSTRSPLPHPIYDSNVFKSRTDDQGRFVITFVPPGGQVIARLVPAGVGSWNHRPVATLEVKPGETVVTNVGGGGRVVTGKLQFDPDVSPDFKSCYVTLATPMAAYRDKLRQLKTDAERQAFNNSDEAVAAKRNVRNFPATVQPDGSLRADEVPPGTYELTFRKHFRPEAPTASMTTFTYAQTVIVPPAANENDDSVVDWGIIEINKNTLPEPDAPLK